MKPKTTFLSCYPIQFYDKQWETTQEGIIQLLLKWQCEELITTSFHFWRTKLKCGTAGRLHNWFQLVPSWTTCWHSTLKCSSLQPTEWGLRKSVLRQKGAFPTEELNRAGPIQQWVDSPNYTETHLQKYLIRNSKKESVWEGRQLLWKVL